MGNIKKEKEIFFFPDPRGTGQEHRAARLGWAELAEPRNFSNPNDMFFEAERDRPDLVIMEAPLPSASERVELAERIRRSFGIPVICLLLQGDGALLDQVLVVMPFGYIIQPIHDWNLKRIMTEVFRGMKGPGPFRSLVGDRNFEGGVSLGWTCEEQRSANPQKCGSGWLRNTDRFGASS